MSDPARDLEAKALRLPPKERARLAARLVSSLDQETDPDAEALGLEEAERRLAELESGKVSSISAEQVLEKARSSLR
jgi:putative addiction module component (TIGR02574 family)